MAGFKTDRDLSEVLKNIKDNACESFENFSNKMAFIKIAIKSDDIKLDNERFSTLIIRLCRLGRIMWYKLKGHVSNFDFSNIPIKINFKDISFAHKKSIILASTCAVSAFTIFFLSSGTEENITNVSAQSNKEIVVEEELVVNSSSKVNNRALTFPTININGQAFATDAKEVSEKLSNYDFYNNGEKVVYLTFDDGPTKYTKDILEILKKYNIRATFFPTGTAIENGGEELMYLLKESYTYGNSIGNHTYSHSYTELYPNGNLDLNAFNSDIERNLTLLKKSIGSDFETNLIRCPGGFTSWGNMTILEEQLKNDGMYSIDWNAITGDTSKKNTDVNSMLSTAVETSLDKNLVVLLMHETNALTPQYLDKVIKYYHSNGYTFKTIA